MVSTLFAATLQSLSRRCCCCCGTLLQLEVAVLPTDAWGFKAASSAVTTANMATQTDIEVACDDSDDDEEELLEAQQEQAHVQVVLNVRESFMEEANLKVGGRTMMFDLA